MALAAQIRRTSNAVPVENLMAKRMSAVSRGSGSPEIGSGEIRTSSRNSRIMRKSGSVPTIHTSINRNITPIKRLPSITRIEEEGHDTFFSTNINWKSPEQKKEVS